MNKKTIKVRRYKVGYEIRTEEVDDSEYGGGFIMKSAYTHNGDYIGEPRFAYHLCKKLGIKPEKISDNSNVCSIGFCEKEQKWYGWSHRALFGFGVGSRVKRGDCGYTPGNAVELYVSLSKEEQKSVVAMDGDKITISQTLSNYETPVNPNVGDEVDSPTEFYNNATVIHTYTIDVGRGEWTAETLEDAKQMAIDFARGVS